MRVARARGAIPRRDLDQQLAIGAKASSLTSLLTSSFALSETRVTSIRAANPPWTSAIQRKSSRVYGKGSADIAAATAVSGLWNRPISRRAPASTGSRSR